MELVLQRLLDANHDVARFFLHNPLPGHKQGYLLALAASAAQRQGRFWEVHGELLRRGHNLNEDQLLAVVRKAGLDVPLFLKDMKRKEIKEHVERDRALVAALGLRGTPVFLVNGKVVLGAIAQERFASLVDKERIAMKSFLESGTALQEAHLAVAQSYPPYHTVLSRGVVWEKGTGKAVSPRQSQRYAVAVAGKPDLGEVNAPVTLVQYIDLTCRFSGQAFQQARSLAQQPDHRMRVFFRISPSVRAQGAFEAAMCAQQARQSKVLIPFLDAWFSSGQDVGSRLERAARKAAIDCSDTTALKEKFDPVIRRTKIDAVKVEAVGTPVSYVNGVRKSAVVSDEEMAKLVEAELSLAVALLDKGLRPELLYPFIISRAHTVPLLETVSESFPPLDDALMLGRKDATVKLLVFWDYASPFCRNLWLHLSAIRQRYPEEIALYFKMLPAQELRHSSLAAVAAACAGEKGLFSAYHVQLMTAGKENYQKEWLEELAEQMGIEKGGFTTCMLQTAPDTFLSVHREQARQAGVDGAPALFANGHRVRAPAGLDFYSIMASIEQLN